MVKIAKILLPVDFSKEGAGAARHAGALARHFGAELTLFHANPVFVSGLGLPREFTGPIDTGWVTALEAQRGEDLANYHADELEGVTVKHVVITGDPAQSIVDYAHREHMDLIVMPTHGYGGFRRSLLGSVTAKVLHDAACPVWTGAHLQETPPREWETMVDVLCAIDNSQASEHVLRWARSLAGEFQAPLIVVHAVSKIEPPDDFLDEETRQRRLDTAASTVRCFQTKTGAKGEIVIAEGDPSKVVAGEALRYNAGVVVIGRTPPEKGEGRLRAHAYSILRESPCPVLSV
jgi:nucleotide-binding universal stress UspA family protein